MTLAVHIVDFMLSYLCCSSSVCEMLYWNVEAIVSYGMSLCMFTGTFCSIEIDSFGHFFEKAKTRVLNTVEPHWEEVKLTHISVYMK